LAHSVAAEFKSGLNGDSICRGGIKMETIPDPDPQDGGRVAEFGKKLYENSGLADLVEDLREKVDSISEHVTGLRADIRRLTASLTTLVKRIERLETPHDETANAPATAGDRISRRSGQRGPSATAILVVVSGFLATAVYAWVQVDDRVQVLKETVFQDRAELARAQQQIVDMRDRQEEKYKDLVRENKELKDTDERQQRELDGVRRDLDQERNSIQQMKIDFDRRLRDLEHPPAAPSRATTSLTPLP
jgi:chromosome segregation ATPase